MKGRPSIALAVLLFTALIAVDTSALAREVPATGTGTRGVQAFLERAPTYLFGVERDADGSAIWIAVRRFYERRGFRLSWLGRNGPEPATSQLLAALRTARRDGLSPSRYHPLQLERQLERAYRSKGRSDHTALDVLLTDMCLRYAYHLERGHIDPSSIELAWYAPRRRSDLAAVVASALDKENLSQALDDLAPSHPEYAQLRELLARYRRIGRAGGWPRVPDGPTLRPDDLAPTERLQVLEQRLAAESYLDAAESAVLQPALTPACRDLPDGPEPVEQSFATYDMQLADALRRFQRHHGIKVDGVIGPATRRELNIPAQQRVRQIELNMERWRWLPEHLGERHIRVNVPAFELALYEQGRAVLSMGVIVGKRGWGTPLFSDTMGSLIINPYWNVPESIAVEDILPKVRRDPSYLERNNFVVFNDWGHGAERIDPWGVDWASIPDDRLTYRFRQDPGPTNPLGRVKFIFPNQFHVYFHDTPKKQLFERTARAFSHGCIRVENPVELALRLLQPDPQWTPERLRDAIDSGEHHALRLAKPVPVYVLYWTAFADSDGAAEFRTDMYEIDQVLARALRQESAGAPLRVARSIWGAPRP